MTVFAVDKGNKIEERQVQTGIETPNSVEVVSGLDETTLSSSEIGVSSALELRFNRSSFRSL